MRRIQVPFTVKGLKELLNDVQTYEQQLLETRTQQFLDRLAEQGVTIAKESVSSYPHLDDLAGTLPTVNRVEAKPGGEGFIAEVTLNGKDAIFLEFGAGVYYNTPLGTSPHPQGDELGYTIGSYSNPGHAGEDYWRLPSGIKTNGGKNYTHGVKAIMPLHEAAMYIRSVWEDTARSVFG